MAAGPRGVDWHEHEGLDDADAEQLGWRARGRVPRALRRAGKWWDEGDAAGVNAELDCEQELLLALA